VERNLLKINKKFSTVFEKKKKARRKKFVFINEKKLQEKM